MNKVEEVVIDNVSVTIEGPEGAELYWKVIKKEDDGTMYIKVYGDEQQQRIQQMIDDSKVKYIGRLRNMKSLKSSAEKAAIINAVLVDDKLSKVIPGRSLLYGNNVQVIPERSEFEKSWNRSPEGKQSTKAHKVTSNSTKTVVQKTMLHGKME